MKASRLTVREIMIGTGVIGSALGLFLRNPFGTLLGAILLAIFLWVGKKWFSLVPLKIRLVIEVTTLIGLLHYSAIVWTPRFYTWEASRCDRLARQARGNVGKFPKIRQALLIEADWFERRASELRWEGYWRGFRFGPATRNELFCDYGSEFGTIESLDKHASRLNQWIGVPDRWDSLYRPY